MISTSDVLELTQFALGDFENVDLATSARRAYRISRLLGHGDESWFFRADLRPTGGSGSLRIAEISDLFKDRPYEEIRAQNTKLRESWINERSPKVPDDLVGMSQIEKDSILPGSIDELETHLRRIELDASTQVPDLKALLLMRADLNREVLLRIKARTFGYLCMVETTLGMSVASNEIFEARRRRVDIFMREISGDILEKFNVAYRRIRENDPEARSQALGSCRRILKCVADVVCPPTSETVVDSKGTSHSLTDDKYLNRIAHFLEEQILGTRFLESLHATLNEVITRIDTLNNLSSKGVHAEVTPEEVEWCVIQMYLLAGEILRMHQVSMIAT